MDSAVLAIAQHLEDACPDVREATVSALHGLDPVECNTLIMALVRRLNHEDTNIRLASVKALALVVEPGNAIALDAITRLLDDEDAGVRWATVEAMGRIARPGSMTDLAVDAIAQRMMSVATAPESQDVGCGQDNLSPPGVCRMHSASEVVAWEVALHDVGRCVVPDAPLSVAMQETGCADLAAPATRPLTPDFMSMEELRTMDTTIIDMKDLERPSMVPTNKALGAELEYPEAEMWWSALEAMSRISVPDKTNTMQTIIERLHQESFSRTPMSNVDVVIPPVQMQHLEPYGERPTVFEVSGVASQLDCSADPKRMSMLSSRQAPRGQYSSLLKAMETILEEDDVHTDRSSSVLR